MPEGYERSRARLYRDDGGDGGGYGRPGGGRNRLVWIAGAAVVVVVAVVVFIIVKNMFGTTPADNQPQQTDPTITAEAPLPTDTVEELPSATPEDTSLIDDTSSPDDTLGPDDTSTDPGDTTEPDDTATIAPTSTPQPTATKSTGSGGALEAPAVEGKAKVENYLPLHKSASSSSETLVKIDKDETFTILAVSTTKTWLKVKYNDKTGYVLAQYVSIGDNGDSKVCTVTSTTVNVRSGAGKTNDVIGTLKKDDTVIVLSTETKSDGKWYKISIGDTTGYVFADNCRLCQR